MSHVLERVRGHRQAVVKKTPSFARSDLSNRETFSWHECDPQGSANADTSNVNFSGMKSLRPSVFTVTYSLHLSSNAQPVNRYESYSNFALQGWSKWARVGTPRLLLLRVYADPKT